MVCPQLIEHITVQAMIKLGGTTALLKAHSTKCLEYCAREAAQVWHRADHTRPRDCESEHNCLDRSLVEPATFVEAKV